MKIKITLMSKIHYCFIKMNILIIEDDNLLSKSLENSFKKNSFANIINIISSYNDFLNNSNISCYDIILLDICLWQDNFHGIDILKIIRKSNTTVPIIMMSAFNCYKILEDTFHHWAHDYIIKPFRNRELQIRIKRWFNNYLFNEYYSIKKILYYRDLEYRLWNCEFYFQNTKLNLSKWSKHVLLLLLINKEELVSNQYLSEKIWGEHDEEKNIRIKILRLKKSLKLYNLSDWVKTVRGEGYMLLDSPQF